MTTFEKWSDMPLGSIKPRGWLLRYLQLQKEGLTGHLEVAGYPFDSVSWAVGDEASASGTENPGWWAYEQTAYWLDGMVRAGILLDDSELLSRADTIIQSVMDQADDDEYLGPKFLKSTDGWCRWPHVVFFSRCHGTLQLDGGSLSSRSRLPTLSQQFVRSQQMP